MRNCAPETLPPRRRPFTVILTGGIASGKSAASRHFEALGAAVIDTDVIASELVKPGRAALGAIIDAFGSAYLLADGNLDRAKMKSLIFSDTRAKARLESILHPAIAAEVQRLMAAADGPYCVVVVPLFVETGIDLQADRILVVDVDEKIQLERLLSRDRLSLSMANAILRSQASRSQRLGLADDVIENNGSISELQARVEELNSDYEILAQLQRTGTGK